MYYAWLINDAVIISVTDTEVTFRMSSLYSTLPKSDLSVIQFVLKAIENERERESVRENSEVPGNQIIKYLLQLTTVENCG